MCSTKTGKSRKKTWDSRIETPTEETGGKGVPWGAVVGLSGGPLCLGPESNQTTPAGSHKAPGGEGVCLKENK